MTAEAIDTPSYEIIGRSSEREEWLKLRRTGIGASEIAAVLGRSRWKSRYALWAEKCGLIAEPNLEENEPVQWGNILEAPVAREWARRVGARLTMSGALLRSNRHPWALATLDAEWWLGGARGYLEVKTVGLRGSDAWVDGPPEDYELQVQQQMLVTGDQRAAIACLVGGQELRWAWVDRDERMIRQIIAAGEVFWALVQSRTPPEADGSESTARALKEAFAQDNGESVELDAELRSICEELEALRTSETETKAERVRLENQLKRALGPHQRGAIAGGWSVSWATQERAAYSVKAGKTRVLRVHPPKED